MRVPGTIFYSPNADSQAEAADGDRSLFVRYAASRPDVTPVNAPLEFLAFCGVVGLGACLARGETDLRMLFRAHANDPCWRTREAAAMALQRCGRADRRSEAFVALRESMDYCWSVAVAAKPELGIPYLERWLEEENTDVRWIVKQNLTKKRLVRAEPDWTAAALSKR